MNYKSCKLGILDGTCEKGSLICKYYRPGKFQTEECSLYEMLNGKYMKDKEISAFNIFLGGVLKKD